MDTPSEKPTTLSKAEPRMPGTFFLLQTTFLVGLVLATLFTAWNPNAKASIPPDNQLTQLIGASSTQASGAAAPQNNGDNANRIGIVAGHWGNDSGAVCADGLTETDINQRIAALVQKSLTEQGFQVDVLREFDYGLSNYKAAVLVSIHADSCDYINDQATGFKVAAALGSTRKEKAVRLTACLRARYGAATGLPIHSTSVTNDMTQYHAFDEIDPNTTAAIIEVGFMNLDRQILEKSPEIPAQGIVSGILCYLRNESITLPTADAAAVPIEAGAPPAATLPAESADPSLESTPTP
jgi:N-acetylmuramoyl-L-alanine amidase